MHKFKLIIVFVSLISCAVTAMAQMQDDLKTARLKVINEYLADLQQGDYKHITQLFAKDGVVISTSAGKKDPKDFFYNFLSNIVLAKTKLHSYFINCTEDNRLAASFYFDFKLKDGEQGRGEYMDEFVFVNNSNKLSMVVMYENLKFN